MEDKRSLDLLKTVVVKFEEEQVSVQAPGDYIGLMTEVHQLFPGLVYERFALADASLREINSKETYLSAVEQGVILIQKKEQNAEMFAEWYNGCFWRWSKNDKKLHKVEALSSSELTWAHCSLFLSDTHVVFFSADNTYVLDVRALTLTSKARMNVGRYYFAYLLFAGCIYALGGCDEAGYTDVCERYSPVLNKWTYICSHPGPGRTGMSACGYVGKLIFLFGGFDGVSYLDHVSRYSLEDGMWRALPVRLPMGTYYLASVQVQDRILIFGGKGNRKSFWLHPQTLLITEGPSLPSDLSFTKFRQPPIISGGKVQIMNLDYKVLELSGATWSVIYSLDH